MKARFLRGLRARKTVEHLLSALTGGDVYIADLPAARHIVALREYVEDMRQGRVYGESALAPNPGDEARAKIKQLSKLPFRDATELLDLIMSAVNKGGERLAGVTVYSRRSGAVWVRGARLSPIAEGLRKHVERVTVLSSTLPAELLTPWFAEVRQEGEWSDPEDDPVERVQVLVGSAVSSVVDMKAKVKKGDPRPVIGAGRNIADSLDGLRLFNEALPMVLTGPKKVTQSLAANLRAREADGRPRTPLTAINYHKLMGRNDLASYGTYVSVGRTLPSYRDVRLQLEALTGGPVAPPPNHSDAVGVWWDSEAVTCRTKGGEEFVCQQPTHEDPLVAAYLRELAISPLVQSDRSRAYTRTTRARRVVFSTLPLPGAVDRVERYAHLMLDEVTKLGQIGVLPDPDGSANGQWGAMAMFLGEDDPFGAGSVRLKKRLGTRGVGKDEIARRSREEMERWSAVAPIRIVVEREGMRPLRPDFLVCVPGVGAQEIEASAEGGRLLEYLREQGLTPTGATVKFEIRRPRKG
jgi:hypothetical protein